MNRFIKNSILIGAGVLAAGIVQAQTPTPTATLPHGMCKSVLAYYTSWTRGSYGAANVPYNKLTHICHAFVLPNTDGSLNVPGGYLEPALNTGAHAAGDKVLVSIGGAGAGVSPTFRTLAASVTTRTNFALQVYNFCLANNYDGVDVDWEYPQGASDRANFNLLIQAIRTQFDASPAPAPSWIISAAVSPQPYFAQWLDLPVLKNTMNFFNLMCYDYHGSWSDHSGHNAALFQAAGEPPSDTGADGMDGVNYFTGRGVPSSQLYYGLAFYGYGFDTANIFDSCACNTDTLPFSQVLPLIGNGWTRYWDPSAYSPYLLPTGGGVSMITYDDPPSILAKSNYVLNAAGVGGVFMWALNNDYLGPNNQPLLDAMVQMASLCGSPTPTPFPTYTPIPTPTPLITSVWRVNAGGPAFTDSLGNLWRADTQYFGGSSATSPGAISGTVDDTLYQSERWGNSTYTFNTPPGNYQVTLKFAEVYSGITGAGQRVFNVSINGVQVLSNLDIYAEVGPRAADDKVFSNITPNGGGQIVVQFGPASVDSPKVSALQVIPMPPTPTFTPTSTFTLTPTNTSTPCMSGGTPCTSSPTPTATFTPTATPTPGGNSQPVLYPNPARDGGPIQLRVNTGSTSEVRVRVYTTAFRKVREESFPVLGAGPKDLMLDLLDKERRPLANGLYYVMVDGVGKRWVLKLLVFK